MWTGNRGGNSGESRNASLANHSTTLYSFSRCQAIQAVNDKLSQYAHEYKLWPMAENAIRYDENYHGRKHPSKKEPCFTLPLNRNAVDDKNSTNRSGNPSIIKEEPTINHGLSTLKLANLTKSVFTVAKTLEGRHKN